MNLESRLWAKVNKTETCWLWTGNLNGDGYGRLEDGGRRLMAHRVAYELLVGPIPKGMEIDHVRERGCFNTNCVNPDHLEPVTHRENLLRGRSFSAINAAKTHCLNGHEFDEANTYWYEGLRGLCRQCRQCAHDRWAANYVRKRNPLGASATGGKLSL